MSLELVISGHFFRSQKVGSVPRSSAVLEARYDTIGQWTPGYAFEPWELIRTQMLYVENSLSQDPKGALNLV